MLRGVAASPSRFDVFLSYSRRDAREVEVLAGRLAREAGLAVWMDRARLQPGASWRGEIEEAMNGSAAAVVVWGPGGLGPVQRQERDLAYALRDGRPGFHVLYVFLPGTPPPQGTWANVDTWIRFEGGLDEADPFARLVAAVKGEAPSADLAADLPDEPAPYRGLAAFGVEDRRFFFGRSAEIAEMEERLAHHPFLAVLGASGSGKTSLVQAGLLARLPAAEWEELVVRPGPRPLHALAGALARFRPGDPLAAADDLLRRLDEAPGELPALLALLLPAGRRLALVVDRLEELFTLAEADGKTEQEKLIAAVLALARAPEGRARVVATMRADFYGRLGRYPDLAGQVVDHQLYIKDLDQGAVAEVIEAPAAQVGAIFEKGLAARVRDDASQGGEVVLPLLQHALDLLWRKRRGRWLTWDAYREIEGVQGALRFHADGVIKALGTEERKVSRGLLTRLVWIDEETATATAGRRLGQVLAGRGRQRAGEGPPAAGRRAPGGPAGCHGRAGPRHPAPALGAAPPVGAGRPRVPALAAAAARRPRRVAAHRRRRRNPAARRAAGRGRALARRASRGPWAGGAGADYRQRRFAGARAQGARAPAPHSE